MPAAAEPLPLRFAAAVPLPHRFARYNPTPRRLGAARVWTLERLGVFLRSPDLPEQPQCGLRLLEFGKSSIVRVDSIAIQPDLTGHKSEPVRSLRLPKCCDAWVRQVNDGNY